MYPPFLKPRDIEKGKIIVQNIISGNTQKRSQGKDMFPLISLCLVFVSGCNRIPGEARGCLKGPTPKWFLLRGPNYRGPT